MINKSLDNLIWLDLEMTGLNPDKDRIIEIAVAITNADLSEIVEGPNLVIGQSEKLWDSMGLSSSRISKSRTPIDA